MWNILIEDVKIDAYTLMLNPTILINTFKLLLLILFTDICWVIEINNKRIGKKWNARILRRSKMRKYNLWNQWFYTRKTKWNLINTDIHVHISQFVDD